MLIFPFQTSLGSTGRQDSSLVPSYKALPSYHSLLTLVPAVLFSSYFSFSSLPGETKKKKKAYFLNTDQFSFFGFVKDYYVLKGEITAV